ncbi:MAG: hypothetical protein JNM66_05515 [Bryobacterales bacterium]|nr:hypothetical protein [Bryobacterales bacterium]
MKKVYLAGGLLALAGAAIWAYAGDEIQFRLGGAMVNVGYRLQDPIADYDFAHHLLTPPQVWEQFMRQNQMASSVRQQWPRTSRHPVVAMVTCMDSRLDTNEIAGDTRRYYYVLRLAGSVLSVKEEEMLELAADNGVEVIVFTTHTDCAAEKASKNPAQRAKYPNLVKSIEERDLRFQEFLDRPNVKEKTAAGKLMVKWMDLDTQTERVAPHVRAGARLRPNFAEPESFR